MLVNNAFYEKTVFQKRKYRSSPPEVFLGKGVLKVRTKFTEEHTWRSVISIKLLDFQNVWIETASAKIGYFSGSIVSVREPCFFNRFSVDLTTTQYPMKV